MIPSCWPDPRLPITPAISVCEYSFSRELEIKQHEDNQWVTWQDPAAFKHLMNLPKSNKKKKRYSSPIWTVFACSLS